MNFSLKILGILLLSTILNVLLIGGLFHFGVKSTYITCVLCLTVAVTVLYVVHMMFKNQAKRIKEQSESGGDDFKDVHRFIDSYKVNRMFRLFIVLFFLVMVFFLLVLSLWVGQNELSVGEVFDVLMSHLTGKPFDVDSQAWLDDILIWDIRLPRSLLAIVTGAGLALAGAVMQGTVKNPLADAYTTGISSGAVFGATLFIILGIGFEGVGQYGIVFNSFLFSLIPAFVMIFVSRLSTGSPVTIILVGTAVSYIFSSFTTLNMMLADENGMKSAFEWQVGSLSYANWEILPVIYGITAVTSILLYLTSNKLNVMMAGDKEATSLGLNVDNYRMVCLLLISLLVAGIVSFVGLIGFVGLIVPHIVRMVVGSDSHIVLPVSAIGGAGMMLLADIISRTISTSALPVGVVMSFIGGPIFLMLIIRSRKGVWVDD